MRTRRLGEQRQNFVTRTEGEGRLGGWGTMRPTKILMSNCPPPSFSLHTLGRTCRQDFFLIRGGGGDALVICRSGGRVVWRISSIICLRITGRWGDEKRSSPNSHSVREAGRRSREEVCA